MERRSILNRSDGKKGKIIIISGITAVIFLAAIVAVAVSAARKNPLAKGLLGLSEELTALEAEMGENFWADAINEIGSGNMQAEYSLNIGGISELENITVGVDGKSMRDMEQKLYNSKVDISIANARIAEASLSGTADMLYLQVPSVWEGSVVLNAVDLDGQWNGSVLKNGLQLLTGQELGIEDQIDVDLFKSFSVNSFSMTDFLEENGEALRNLYKNMEVVEIGKAEKTGMLRGEQVSALERDASGELIETTYYLVVLPEKEMKELIRDVTGDIRLCVCLDSGKRIVRSCSLPEESFKSGFWEGGFAISLTGTEFVTDRVEIEVAGEFDGRETEERIILEKEAGAAGAYRVVWKGSLTDEENIWNFSLEGGIQGEGVTGENRSAAEEQDYETAKLSMTVDNFVLKSGEEVICRGSGSAAFSPLTEEIEMPAGKEYRIAEMDQWDTAMFLMECTKNVGENYSGYLKFLQ